MPSGASPQNYPKHSKTFFHVEIRCFRRSKVSVRLGVDIRFGAFCAEVSSTISDHLFSVKSLDRVLNLWVDFTSEGVLVAVRIWSLLLVAGGINDSCFGLQSTFCGRKLGTRHRF